MIRDRSQELGTFHTRHFAEPMGKRPASTNGHHSELTDEEVIALARGAKNAAKFEALWEGDTAATPATAKLTRLSLACSPSTHKMRTSSIHSTGSRPFAARSG